MKQADITRNFLPLSSIPRHLGMASGWARAQSCCDDALPESVVSVAHHNKPFPALLLRNTGFNTHTS
jgi:hypothetical protein